jgi:SAM-dependent methyltransferase
VLLADRLRSFHRRRIALPVRRGDLVLDVGSGDKPSWRADVLLDGYPGDEHAVQRSGTRAARVDRPLFVADAADMPFADDAFDYVICSHVLEHVLDPAAVVAELSRVARAGYIEVPLAASSKILDFPSHLWWCRQDEDGTLVLTAKTEPWHDREIHDHLAATGLDRTLDELLNNAYFHHHLISVSWSGSVSVRVEGTPSEAVLEHARSTEAEHHGREALAARVLTSVLTLPRRRRPRPVRLGDIVRPGLVGDPDQVLEARVYELT